jgi:hypothetical protein
MKFEGGLEIKKLDSVESIEAEIKMLQSKLEFYKELERTKTPCEKAFKRVYGYYSNPNESDTTWIDFVNGYKSAQEDYKVGEYQEVEENDKNFKNTLDLIKKWGEENKPKTLYQICMEWWDDVFVNEMDNDICIDVLVSKIDKEFIPPHSNTNDYQWNKCLKIMRDKLR